MGSMKPVFVLAILAGIGYVTFIALNSGPPAEPPPDAPTDWEVPDIQLGDVGPAMEPTPVSPGTGMSSSPAPKFGEQPEVSPASVNVPVASAPPFGSTQFPSISQPPSMNPTGNATVGTSLPGGVPQPAVQASTSLSPGSAIASDPFAINNPLGAGLPASPPVPPASAEPPPASAGSAVATDDVTPVGTSAPEFQESVNKIEKLLENNQLAEAHLELSRWFRSSKVSPEDHQEVVHLLDQLAGTVIYSREHLLQQAYEVKPGQQLGDVARECRVPKELLAKINGIGENDQLVPGEKLKVVTGPFEAFIDLERRELTLMLQGENGGVGRYAGRFPIDVPSGAPVREGKFFVQNKSENPAAIHLGNGVAIESAEAAATPSGVPAGIRLGQRDLGDVYDMLAPGSSVVIRR